MKVLRGGQRVFIVIAVCTLLFAGQLLFSTYSEAEALADRTAGASALTPRTSLVSLGTSAAFPNILAALYPAGSVPWFSPICGNCWLPFKTSPSSTSPSQIAVAPRDDGTPRFLVTVTGQGVYRTGDTGNSWAVQSFPHPGDCTEPDQFQNLVASPLDPRRLYLIKYCYYADPMSSVAYYSVYTSPDSGLTWQAIRGGGQGVWKDLVASPVLSNSVYVMNGAGIWYQSDDAGQTWSPRNYPVQMLALDAAPDLLYGIGAVGKRSPDGGATWIDWKEMPCPASQLLAHPTQSGVLFLQCTQGLYRSVNGGDHWDQLSPDPGQVLTADNGKPGRLLWAKNGELLASDDAGSSWEVLVTAWDQLAPCWSFFFPIIAR